MSKLKDALYDSLHSSEDSLRHAINKQLKKTLKKGKREINTLKVSTKKMASGATRPSQKLLLVAGAAGLATAVYFFYKRKNESERNGAEADSEKSG